ncbi:MAG: transcription antitermination factor NusB [Acidimicrobiia bacterium]|nr:transcription antitermination factor NusB [Acidimicrobiia bacterium]
MTKSSAREQALGALYAADLTGGDPDTERLSARATRYVDAVWSERQSLDDEISAATTGWRVERMPAIDRNIIRLALHELRLGDTPVGVVMSEAVNLAKRFSTERSGAFVNGVLAKLNKS